MSHPDDERAAQVLARAFQEDVFHVGIAPAAHRRRRALPALFHGVVRHARKHGQVLLEAERGALAWLPFSQASMGVRDVLCSGMWKLPWTWSWRALSLLLQHEREALKVIQRQANGAAAYLWVVGVDPSVTARGVGGALIRRALAQMAPSFATCFLKTEQPLNVGLYQHLGFSLVESESTRTVAPIWVMRKQLHARG